MTPKESKESTNFYHHSNCNLEIDGKSNGIILDGCKRVSVVLDDVISSIEVMNSWNIQMQVSGQCPTVSIEGIDGCQVYLSKASTSAQFKMAKSSGLNILIPASDDEEFSEHTIPEQFKKSWNGRC